MNDPASKKAWLGRWNGEPEIERKENGDLWVRFTRFFADLDAQFDVEKASMGAMYQSAHKSNLGKGLWVVYA